MTDVLVNRPVPDRAWGGRKALRRARAIVESPAMSRALASPMMLCIAIAAVAALIWTGAVSRDLRALDDGLTTMASPRGILSFEFAASMADAQGMLTEWARLRQLGTVARSLIIDTRFIAAYGSALALVALWGALIRRLPRTYTLLLVALPVIAAVCDLAENWWLAVQLDAFTGALRAGGPDLASLEGLGELSGNAGVAAQMPFHAIVDVVARVAPAAARHRSPTRPPDSRSRRRPAPNSSAASTNRATSRPYRPQLLHPWSS